MNSIKQLRNKIDEVDEEIVHLLAKRAKICETVGTAKKVQGLPIRDGEREGEVYKRARQRAAQLSLNPVQVEAVYREIVNMCSSVQE